MTENPPAEQPTRQAIEARDRSKPMRVTGKLRIAIERMVWYGEKRASAAEFAKLSDHGLRQALRKPHVLAFLRNELTLLREGERPRNFHRLVELREQDENRNAAVKAIQVLEQLTEGSHGAAINISLPAAGWIIDLSERGEPMRIVSPQPQQPAPAQPRVIEHEPAPSDTQTEDAIAKSAGTIDKNKA